MAEIFEVESLHVALRSKVAEFSTRVGAVDDAIGAAVDRQDASSSEVLLLQALRARLQGLVGPMDDIEADVNHLVETLKPYTDQAARIDSEQLALGEREADIAEGENLLQTDRAAMDADRRELRRARTDHQDYLVLARAVEAGTEGDAALHELNRITVDLKQQLRAAEDQIATQRRDLEKHEVKQEEAHAKIAKLGEVNNAMRDELRKVSRDAERRVLKAEAKMGELARQLEQSRDDQMRSEDLLAAETRKQRVLQQALQKELSSRGGSGGGDTWASSPTRARAVSAPIRRGAGNGLTGHLDIVATIQRNQSLINELTERRVENGRLRKDNAQLLLHAKDVGSDSKLLRAQVTTSVHDRTELIKKLNATREEANVWKHQLQSTAETMIRRHQYERASAEEARWDRLEELDINESPSRRSYRSKSARGVRSIPVEHWGGGGKYGKYGRA